MTRGSAAGSGVWGVGGWASRRRFEPDKKDITHRGCRAIITSGTRRPERRALCDYAHPRLKPPPLADTDEWKKRTERKTTGGISITRAITFANANLWIVALP
jgi:hypothetical protein